MGAHLNLNWRSVAIASNSHPVGVVLAEAVVHGVLPNRRADGGLGVAGARGIFPPRLGERERNLHGFIELVMHASPLPECALRNHEVRSNLCLRCTIPAKLNRLLAISILVLCRRHQPILPRRTNPAACRRCGMRLVLSGMAQIFRRQRAWSLCQANTRQVNFHHPDRTEQFELQPGETVPDLDQFHDPPARPLLPKQPHHVPDGEAVGHGLRRPLETRPELPFKEPDVLSTQARGRVPEPKHGDASSQLAGNRRGAREWCVEDVAGEADRPALNLAPSVP